MKELRFLQAVAVGAGLWLFAGGTALAQEPSQTQSAPQQQAPADAQKPVDYPKLNLTDDQKAQIKKIHEDAKSQMEALHNDSSLSPEQKQTKAREIHQAAREQMSSILTPEQREIMKERRHERRHHARMKRHAQRQNPGQE